MFSGYRPLWAALVAGCCLAAAAETMYTDADGTTFDVTDKVLTITTPAAITNTHNYAGLLTGVTNIVKTGAGTLDAVPIAFYTGDIEVSLGCLLIAEAGDLGADNVGKVNVKSGGGIWNEGSATIASGKTIYLAGNGPNGANGAVRASATTANTNPFPNCRIVLTANARWYANSKAFNIAKSTLDVAGHTLEVKSVANYNSLNMVDTVIVTNSNDSANGCVSINSRPNSSIGNTDPEKATRWLGGSRNTLYVGNDDRVTIGGLNYGDWTLDLVGGALHLFSGGNSTNYQWFGAVKVRTTSGSMGTKIMQDQVNQQLTLSGPISGTGYATLRNSTLNILSPHNTYSGEFHFYSQNTQSHPLLKIWDGAVFAPSVFVVDGTGNSTGGDIQLGTATAYALNDFRQIYGKCTISGAASADSACGRSTMKSITKSGGTTLTIAAPLEVTGLTDISVGTLALASDGAPRSAASLPVFRTLSVAADASLDLAGNNLAVPNLINRPGTLLNPGTLTVTDSWTVDRALSNGSGLVVSPSANLALSDGAELGLVESFSVHDLALSGDVRITAAAGCGLSVSGQVTVAAGTVLDVPDGVLTCADPVLFRVTAADGAALSVGETVAMYFPAGVTPPDVSRFYGIAAPGNGVTFELRAVTAGDHAGQTALVATVTEGVASATWAATSAGGAYETAANWEGESRPANGAAVTFPAAARAGVAVAKSADSVVGGIAFGAGADSETMAADWFSGFGYAISGNGRILLGSDSATISSGGGVNTIAAPIVGNGMLTVTTDLYPFTNAANAVYSRTILTEDALAGFTGTIVANPTQKGYYLAGHTELHTGSFAGRLSAGFGETSVDSLAFVKSKDDLTLGNYGTLNYTGPDAAISGLTWAVDNAFAISNAHDLTVAELSTGTKNGALFKAGAGTLAICGTGNAYFAKQDANSGSAYGFPHDFGAQGRVARNRYKSLNICDGTVKVGEIGNPAHAPTLQLASMTLGQGYVPTGNARFQLDNGTVSLSGTIHMGFYVQDEPETAAREFVVNGGTLTAAGVSGARLGYRSMTRGRHAFEVNGGTFTLNGPFDLTQLSPTAGAPSAAVKSDWRESMRHTLTVNGGECSCTIFRMGYSYGLTWDNRLSDNNGYGHGWQPDAYLTMNGGTMTVSDHLLAGDRRDSRSWTILNGGVLKVNMLTNTYATASAATDDGAANFIFNGGVYAPIGDGDVPDELVMKRLTTAVVSTNGAAFTTEHMPAGVSFTVEQALTHDSLCGDDPDGGLTKAGAGRLVLAGANTFTGPLQVTGGTLAISAAGGVASKAAALSGDGVLELGEGVVLKLDSLEIDGAMARNGIFGGAESHGNKLYAAHFAGKGVVQVGMVGTMLIFR